MGSTDCVKSSAHGEDGHTYYFRTSALYVQTPRGAVKRIRSGYELQHHLRKHAGALVVVQNQGAPQPSPHDFRSASHRPYQRQVHFSLRTSKGRQGRDVAAARAQESRLLSFEVPKETSEGTYRPARHRLDQTTTWWKGKGEPGSHTSASEAIGAAIPGASHVRAGLLGVWGSSPNTIVISGKDPLNTRDLGLVVSAGDTPHIAPLVTPFERGIREKPRLQQIKERTGAFFENHMGSVATLGPGVDALRKTPALKGVAAAALTMVAAGSAPELIEAASDLVDGAGPAFTGASAVVAIGTVPYRSTLENRTGMRAAADNFYGGSCTIARTVRPLTPGADKLTAAREETDTLEAFNSAINRTRSELRRSGLSNEEADAQMAAFQRRAKLLVQREFGSARYLQRGQVDGTRLMRLAGGPAQIVRSWLT